MDLKHLRAVFAAIFLFDVGLFALSCECLPPENPRSDLFFDASYTYWGEEGLDFGRSGDFLSGDDPLFNNVTTFLSQSFGYCSGFRVGAGWRREDWVLSGEYTWVRNTSLQNSLAPIPDPDLGGTGVWLIAPWFLQTDGTGGVLSGTQVVSKWSLAMDIADLTLSRSYYEGCHLTLFPFAGLRAAWIRQKMNIAFTEVDGLFPAPPPGPTPQPIHSLSGSNSWSIGPRFGTGAHALLGGGFRIEGDLALSLLWTEYTKIFHKEDAAETEAFPLVLYAHILNQTALRPVLECGLGIGWGSYLCADRYHIDFSADYDFMLWWNQNMMREMLDRLWREIGANGDLYLHGLTLSGRFDF